jgi:hypothetical protein
MAEKVSPLKLREKVLSLRNILKDILENLKTFVEVEDYSFIEKAQQLCESLDGKELSGFEDLKNNVKAIYLAYKKAGGKIDTDTHAHLVSQAVYVIVRTNILLTGLEFKVKRMRGF